MTDEIEPGDAGGDDDGIPAAPEHARRWHRWPPKAAHEIVRRTAAGETLLSICRDPEMPGPRIVFRWMAERTAFREAMEKARKEAGRSLFDTSTYCRETAEAIFARLCAGEGLIRICQDPAMPANITVYRWMAKHEDFRLAIALAREIAAEGFFEKGWDIAEAATPETAYVTEVKLKHLRWHAGKLSPKKYGGLKPQDPPAETDAGRNNLTVVIKRYSDTGEFAPGETEKVLYRTKALPQTPAARRAAEQEEGEEAERFRREKEQALEEALRKEHARRAGVGAETSDDPQGWR